MTLKYETIFIDYWSGKDVFDKLKELSDLYGWDGIGIENKYNGFVDTPEPCIVYSRPETTTETAERVKREDANAKIREGLERAQYEVLKKKFES